MRILNRTVLRFGLTPGRIEFPAHSLTIVMKGTFDLKPGEPIRPAEEQPYPTGPEPYPDDEEGTRGPRYAGDFALAKPRADLLLVGKCHVPGGEPQQDCRVTFRVGDHSRALAVIGDRQWKRGLLRWKVSQAAPFTQMEIRYENAFGGANHQANPTGNGLGWEKAASGAKIRPLPNIEDLDCLVTSLSTRPAPAGFGPLDPMWELRFKKLGTYKGDWLAERWPAFPTDFDWSHFNAAPPEMHVEGYLRGDEELFFENLHPEHSGYSARLPGIRVRAFVLVEPEEEGAEPEFREVKLDLDTLWVDMEAEQVVLLWRGHTSIRSEEFEEILDLFIEAEDPSAPPRSVEECRRSYDEAVEEWERQVAQSEVPEEEPEASDDEVPEEEEAGDPEAERQEIEQAAAELRAFMAEHDIDPDKEPASEEEDEEDEKEEEEGAPEPLTREDVQARAAAGESLAGENLSELDLSGLDLAGVDFSQAVLTGADLSRSNLTGADLTRAGLARANLSGCNLEGASLLQADLTGVEAGGAALAAANLEGAVLEKARLPGATMDEVNAPGAVFVEADLSGASVRASQLTGADFSRASLSGASFRGSCLAEATLAGAVGHGADFSEADLRDLRAGLGADLAGSKFRLARGAGSIWHGADLTAADFAYAFLRGADFTSARLAQANLSAAEMSEARFMKADLRRAKLVDANLFKGCLERADLREADVRGANLYAVEFLGAKTGGMQRDLANLKMTKLAGE